MTVQYIAPSVGANRAFSKPTVTRDDGIFAAAGADEVRIYIGGNINRDRRTGGTEIYEGFRMLFNTMDDLGIFALPWGSAVYAAVPINSLVPDSVNVAALLTTITDADIGIGIGANVVVPSVAPGPTGEIVMGLAEVFLEDPDN